MPNSSNKTLPALRLEVERIVSICQKKEYIHNTGQETYETSKKVQTCPYSAEDIRNLLTQLKGEYSYKIIDVIEVTSPEFPLKMQGVIDLLLKSKRNPEIVAIPINLGAVSNDADLGINWASLVIKKSNRNTLSALYQESFGNTIDARLKQYLEGCPIHIQDHQTKQQNYNYNSGPCAVLNLHSLATTGVLPDITDKILVNQRKFWALQRLEKLEYKPLIHQLAYKKTLAELRDLTIVLKDLGYLFTKLGELSGELKYYTEAAIFCQYVITILEVDKKLTDESFIKLELTNSYQQLLNIQQLLYSTVGADEEKMPDVIKEATSNKELLLSLRKITDQELQKVESYYQKAKTSGQEEKQQYQELYVNTARELFEYTATEMKKFLAKLYSDCEKEMPTAPPCTYALIGLGSMALQQMTPYSDLEFSILTENEDYKHSSDPKIRQYFKNLSHLVNFKVINLGESIIPTSKYGLDMSHLVHVGVNLDLGGKTPLGRIGGDKKYDLIQAIDGMLSYVINTDSWASHIDKNLPNILENVCYVYGNKDLVETYKSKVKEFLNKKDPNNRSNCEMRALKLLEEGAVEINYFQQTLSLKTEEILFKGDLDKLKPNLFDDEGRLFDVKQEIYRLPDRLVYNLGLYYAIKGKSSWYIADKLASKTIISPEASLNLKNAITFATTLRLKTYAHYKAQKEYMSIFIKSIKTESEVKIQAQQIFHLSEEDLGEKSGLFQYFYTALPLHKRLKDFCMQYQTLSNECKKTFFQNSNFYEDNIANKGFIYYRLAQHKEAQRCLELALLDQLNVDNFQINLCLGKLYTSFGNNDQAITQYQNCLNNFKLICNNQPHPNIAVFLNNLAAAYRNKGQYDEAIKMFEESLEMKKLIFNNKAHSTLSATLNNLGITYYDKGKYDQAIEKFEESLKMKKLIYHDAPHPDIAGTLNNLGEAYKNKGRYDQAIKMIHKSLEMKKIIYKEEPYPDIAASLNNLGTAYNLKGQYDQAIKKYKESLEMRKLIFKDEPHPDIVGLLINLAEAYLNKGQIDQAYEKIQDSQDMIKLIYKDKHHPVIAGSLNVLGLVYERRGQYDQAIEKYQESLEIRKLIFKNKPHPDIVASLNNLGEAYREKGQYDQAMEKYQDSLQMLNLIYKDEPHPDIAKSLNNLGEACRNKGQYDEAIKMYQDAIKMMKLFYNDEPHPAIALCLNNLGVAYSSKGQYDQAMEKYQESLEIRKLMYKGEPHQDTADTLNNLGCAYAAKGQYDEANKKFHESLEIMKHIYKDKPHPAIASSLNNLIYVYTVKGQYDQAIEKCEEIYQMRIAIYKNEPHPDIAASLSNLGCVYAYKRQYDKAIELYKQSLQMRKFINENKPHPDVASSLNKLGCAYAGKGLYNQAIKKFQKSLQMRKLIFNNKPHPDIASSLDKLGSAYTDKGQYDLAIKYRQDNLEMLKILYKNTHHRDVIIAFEKLSLVATKFVENYHLDLKVIEMIYSFTQQKLDFADYQLHYAFALSQDNNDTNLQSIAEIVEEYKLALIFFPKEHSEEQLQIQQTIFDRLAKLTKESQKNIDLWLAITENNITKVQILADNGVDLNYASFLNTTPLIQAVKIGNVDIVSALLSGNIDINKPNNDQASPLCCSLGYFGQAINMQIVELLLKKGVDSNKPMVDGDTPMHMAHYMGHKEAIGLLLLYGANINSQNAIGKTPLHCLLEKEEVSSSTKLDIIQAYCHLYDMTVREQDGKTVTDCVKEHCAQALSLIANYVKVLDSTNF
ncbi:uncharacterized protein LOC105848879 [Hydra vulgaris]|uniref:uncharacterized protein LOC105848879 n=1 Tax=Hydra vulgaris TaxID=6087 RepID=UPI001F5E5F55|nr:uncharacterized protein LOC105848879 [Hydra vulgaris]